MDRIVIERKLEALRHCVARIRSRRPAALSSLVADADAQDVLVLNLSRAVQLCVDIGAHIIATSELPAPATMGDTFLRLAELQVLDVNLAQRLRAAVGFRNIAVHNYEVIDWAVVHALSDKSLADFENFARGIVARCGRAE